jgi:hypothetical protein
MSRFFKLFAATGSLAISAIAWWQTHSIWKTALVAVVSVVVAFGKAVWSHLEPDWAKRVATAIDQFVTIRLAAYGERYTRHLYYQHRTFDIKGFPTQGKFALELENVYVDLSVDAAVVTGIPQDPVRLPSDTVPQNKNSGKARHDVFTWLTVEPSKPRNFAVIGPPGSGKTTMLKHLALTLSSGKSPVEATPVLLFLRDHATTIGADPDTKLAQVIDGSLRDDPPPTGWFEKRLNRGRCLVMFDGLDEIADQNLRIKVVQWVERQVSSLGANRFLVSSRPNGYRNNPLSGFTVLRVLPFDRKQVERFVRNWYLANELVAYQKDDPGVRIEANRGAEDLLARLRSAPALQELAVNPLLLTLIATVHRYRNQLPGRRVELYAEICDVFLGKRQQARGIQFDLTPAQTVRVLRVLAWEMMCREVREIAAEDAARLITDSLNLVTPARDPLAFLQMVEDSSALVVERESGVYGFAHLTFQEYLASLQAKEDKLVADLASRVDKTWWHETVRLYSAQADATPIVAQCLAPARPTVEALLLATDCEEEALELREELREKIRRIVEGALEDPEPDRRRLAAEHMLARRFRNMIRVTDYRYVDACPITNAEYQLFIDDMLAQNLHRQPDHWDTYQFVPGTGAEPIAGIRPSDAGEFCQWLDARRAGEWTWELPTTEDVNDLCGGNAAWKGLIFYRNDHKSQIPEISVKDVLTQVRNDLAQITLKRLQPEPEFPRGIQRIVWFAMWLNAFSPKVDHDPRRVLNRTFELVLDRDHAPQELDSSHHVVSTIVHAIERDLDRCRALALEPAFAREYALLRDLDRDHAPDLELALARDFDSFRIILDRDHTPDLDSLPPSILPAVMLKWFCVAELRAKGKLPVTEGLWIARVRKDAEKTDAAAAGR